MEVFMCQQDVASNADKFQGCIDDMSAAINGKPAPRVFYAFDHANAFEPLDTSSECMAFESKTEISLSEISRSFVSL